MQAELKIRPSHTEVRSSTTIALPAPSSWSANAILYWATAESAGILKTFRCIRYNAWDERPGYDGAVRVIRGMTAACDIS